MADTTRTTSGVPAHGTSTTPPAGGAGQGTRTVEPTARNAGEQRHGIEGAGQAIAETAEHAVSEAKKVGTELVGAVRESAVSLLDTQRERAADQIGAIG